MGWFDEQMKQRIKADEEAFSDAFVDLAGVVMGDTLRRTLLDDRRKTQSAIEEILKFYRVKSPELPNEVTDLDEQLEYLLRPTGIMRRVVLLKDAWYQDGVGAFLGVLKTGGVVALLPHKLGGYAFLDYETGELVKLTARTAPLLEVEAICFYKPFPLKKLKMRDLLVYIKELLAPSDYITVGIAALAAVLLGLLAPALNNIIFSDLIETGSQQLFLAVTVMLGAAGTASVLIGTVKSALIKRLEMKSNTAVQAATMMRLLSLPADFFRQYSAGDLASRSQSVKELCSVLYNAIISAGLTALFSLIYLMQIFHYAQALVFPAVMILMVTVLFTCLSAFLQMKQSNKRMEASVKEAGMAYSLIRGVQKLKLSGAEKRGFSRWAALYGEKAAYTYNPPMLLKLNGVIATGISLVGTIFLYYTAVKSQISVADYLTFHVAFGMVSGAFLTLSGTALTLANIRPIFEMVKPILEAVPEITANKRVLTRITGGIEINNISFRYAETMPLILNNLSLKIRPGEYVAVVGKTGCGKSTLLRLLLGFETPQKGAIYYGDAELAAIDLKSLRRRIGVVLQNGTLFSGDIYSNITISAPWLTMKEVWEAAEIAGIAADIRGMPMGMYTMLTEGGGGISGGQRQRLLIARAVATKPRILLFDEATSALDNLTQKVVTDSLAKLKCTRVVIAHRLSTIRECDRIIVLEQGRIVESGSYEELIQKEGTFSKLVARQRIDLDGAT